MFLHLPDRQTPFEDAVRAMDEGFREGRFKKLGLSNYSAAEVKEIIEICERKGYVKPSVYQGHYNAVVRGGEEELFPLLRKHGIAFYAFRYAHSRAGIQDLGLRLTPSSVPQRAASSRQPRAPRLGGKAM